ncbi:MAG TPA: hypothetical protein VLK34_07165 [Nocardioidaceae bacterium]|nr:hypothetical protein [Nocardioidaceae bacterium]
MVRPLRSCSAVLAAAVVGALLWSFAESSLLAIAGPAPPAPPERPWTLDNVVAAGVAIVAIGAYAILMATALVALGSQLLAPRHAATVAARGWAGPTWWRTAVLTVCGVGVAVQATTADAAVPERPHCATACAPSLDGLPYPDLPTGSWPSPWHDPGTTGDVRADTAPDLHRQTTTRGHAHPTVVVVRPGDTLWSITADLSPPEASDASVAEHVHRLYAANRSAIGDDPDLIYPETTLRVPGGLS